jgi:very-short-patch-repair endonuclease
MRRREPGSSVVTGQAVGEVKMLVARRLRSEMTPEESTLWSHLRGSRFYGLHFRRQQIIDGFIVDFYCHAARLIVEVDCTHHSSDESYDVERDRFIAARGLRILRIRNDEVNDDISAVLGKIRATASANPDRSPSQPLRPSIYYS